MIRFCNRIGEKVGKNYVRQQKDNKKNGANNIEELHHTILSPEIKLRDSSKEKVSSNLSKLTYTTESLRNLGKEDLIKLLVGSEKKASEQDNLIFEMRTLLQSGKGLGDILNLNQLLSTFMAIVRERYNIVATLVFFL